jgi:hypothetical protein
VLKALSAESRRRRGGAITKSNKNEVHDFDLRIKGEPIAGPPSTSQSPALPPRARSPSTQNGLADDIRPCRICIMRNVTHFVTHCLGEQAVNPLTASENPKWRPCLLSARGGSRATVARQLHRDRPKGKKPGRTKGKKFPAGRVGRRPVGTRKMKRVLRLQPCDVWASNCGEHWDPEARPLPRIANSA